MYVESERNIEYIFQIHPSTLMLTPLSFYTYINDIVSEKYMCDFYDGRVSCQRYISTDRSGRDHKWSSWNKQQHEYNVCTLIIQKQERAKNTGESEN